MAFHSVARPGWSLPSGWRFVRLSKTLNVTRMSFDEVEKCGSSFETSPPWAMTSSRFWVVWAAAGLAARPSRRAAAAAPAPSAAARSRKARRERAPACQALARVRKSIGSLLRCWGCRSVGSLDGLESWVCASLGSVGEIVRQDRAGRRNSSSRSRRATTVASSPRRQWGSTRSSPRRTRTMIGGSPWRRASMTASGVRPVDGGVDRQEQGGRGPDAAVLLEARPYAGDAGGGGEDSARLVEVARPLGVVVVLEEELDRGHEADDGLLADLAGAADGRSWARRSPRRRGSGRRGRRGAPCSAGRGCPCRRSGSRGRRPVSVQRRRCPTGGRVEAASTMRGSPWAWAIRPCAPGPRRARRAPARRCRSARRSGGRWRPRRLRRAGVRVARPRPGRRPAMRSAWSYWIRSHRWITISFRIPVVSGRRPMRSGSLPAMHAAAARRSPPAEPEVTWAPSTPTRRAMCAPARAFSSRHVDEGAGRLGHGVEDRLRHQRAARHGVHARGR